MCIDSWFSGCMPLMISVGFNYFFAWLILHTLQNWQTQPVALAPLHRSVATRRGCDHSREMPITLRWSTLVFARLSSFRQLIKDSEVVMAFVLSVRRSGIVRGHCSLISRWPTNVWLAATVEQVGLALQPPSGPRPQMRGVSPVNRTIGENSAH